MREFLLGKRFNQIDLAFICSSGVALGQEKYHLMIGIILVGSLISAVLDRK